MMACKEQMLNDIGTVSFCMVELMLYLDTHPNDRNAMEYFNHYAHIKDQLSREFSREFFPLTAKDSDCNKEWRWGMAPLPWEGVCG